jgi:pimeloyl-ACP methyl ester carboxylesterase
MNMIIASRQPATGRDYPPGTERIEFESGFDGTSDWFYYTPGDSARRTVIYMHGSFSDGTQIYTRQDVRAFWLTRVVSSRHPLLSLNLRGTTYMNPATAADTVGVLAWAQRELGCREMTILGGSGGAISALIYGILHPQDIQGIIALGACDIHARFANLQGAQDPLLVRLAESTRVAYGGTPQEQPELYRAHSVLAHPEHMTMPVVLTIGECDAIIPVAEARKVAAALRWNPQFSYFEISGGDHDSAVWVDVDLETSRICDPRFSL